MAAPYRICLLLMYSLLIQILEVLPSGRIAQQGCRFHLPPNTGLFCIPQARECPLCPQALLTCAARSSILRSAVPPPHTGRDYIHSFSEHSQPRPTFTSGNSVIRSTLCAATVVSPGQKTGAAKRLKPLFLKTDLSLPGIRCSYHMAQSLLSW